MAKDLKISYLLDFYGDMLTQKLREVIDAYYNEDLSLAEIAQEWDITRQGVRDAIKRAEQQLFGALAVICDCALNIQEQNAQKGQVPEIDENAAVILEKAEEIAGES